MMLGEDSESSAYWKRAGDQALANNIKGVILMVTASKPLQTSYSAYSKSPGTLL